MQRNEAFLSESSDDVWIPVTPAPTQGEAESGLAYEVPAQRFWSMEEESQNPRRVGSRGPALPVPQVTEVHPPAP